MFCVKKKIEPKQIKKREGIYMYFFFALNFLLATFRGVSSRVHLFFRFFFKLWLITNTRKHSRRQTNSRETHNGDIINKHTHINAQFSFLCKSRWKKVKKKRRKMLSARKRKEKTPPCQKE